MPGTGSPNRSTRRPASVVARGDRNLLAEDGPHADLERVDGARDPESLVRPHERLAAAVAGEAAVDTIRVGIEVEEATDAGEEVHEPVERREVHAEPQRLLARARSTPRPPPGDPPRSTVRRYTAASRSTDSTPGIARRREEREHRVPRERRTVRHSQLEPTVGDEPIGHAPLARSSLRREPEHLVHHPVELAHAVEPGRGGDWAIGRSVSSSSRRAKCARRRAGNLGSESRRRGRSNRRRRWRALTPRRAASVVLGRAVERAVGDARASHGTRARALRSNPAGVTVGTAAQAGPEPRGFRGRGRAERPHVATERSSRCSRAGSRCRS